MLRTAKWLVLTCCLLLIAGLFIAYCYAEHAANRRIALVNADELDALLAAHRPAGEMEGGGGFLLIEGCKAPYDASSGTYYVPQSMETAGFDGEWTWSNARESAHLYAEGGLDKRSLISSGAPARLIITAGGRYYERKLVFTGLPMLTLDNSPVFDTLYGKGGFGGTLTVFDPGDDGVYQISSFYTRYELRGNTTLEYRHYEKDQYTLHLIDRHGEDLCAALLGMEPADRFRLNAMIYEANRVRDAFALGLWNALCDQNGQPHMKTADFRYAELLLNGGYYGLFGVMRDIPIVAEQDFAGYETVYKVVRHLDQPDGTLKANYRNVHMAYPKEFSVSRALRPLNAYLDAFTVYKDERSFAELTAMVDMPNFVDYALYTQLLAANDNLTLNFYCCVSGDGVYRKIPWDLDRTLNSEGIWPAPTEAAESYSLPFDATALIEKDPAYMGALLNQRWTELRGGLYALDSLEERLYDAQKSALDSGALTRDAERWLGGIVSKDLAPLVDLISRRLVYLDGYFASLCA